jgi:hypothetical protein
MSKLAFLLYLLVLLSPQALASLTDQEMLLAPPTSPAQSVAETEEEAEFSYRKFSVGLGGGINSFGGNIGHLYGTSPVLGLRGDWAFDPMFSAGLGGELANYSFTAAPNGSVAVSTQTLSLAARYHFLSTALKGEGFNPYVSAQLSHLWRSQNFQSHNSVEKDSAMGLGASAGTDFLLAGGKFGFWAEAGVSKIFFQDRFQQEYLASGVEDTTGPLYTGRLGVKVLF